MNQVSKVTCMIGGQERTLAFDLNCVEALETAKGPDWNRWLMERFVGRPKEGGAENERELTAFTTGEVVTVLFALLTSDREVKELDETEKTLRRGISMLELPELQNAVVRVVFKSYGVSESTISLALGATPVDTAGAPAAAKNVPLARALRRREAAKDRIPLSEAAA